MSTKINWQSLANALKSEADRIAQEIKKFDYQAVLSPAAAEKVKRFEKRYAEVLKQIQKVQRQADREFNRILLQVEKAGNDLRKRFLKKTPQKKARKRTKKA